MQLFQLLLVYLALQFLRLFAFAHDVAPWSAVAGSMNGCALAVRVGGSDLQR
jgi:hypothetical protein